MYLSQLILNPRNRRVQKEIADRYQLHRSIMRAFPDDLDATEERVLFRVDEQHRGGDLRLLVQSLTMPDWTWLAEPDARGYLLPVSRPNPALKPFELDLAPGQRLAFRLRANPTARRRLSDGSRKRVGLCREEEQLEWLERKAERGGFRVLSVRTSHASEVHGWVQRNGTVHRLTLLSVQFDGLLRVQDPDQVRETVRQGIGSAKSFGFGLLSLAPPRIN
jgi:CRISPR system Cascade subunit CasE